MAKQPPHIRIPGSKSISNRLLVLQAFYPVLKIRNLSTARDTALLQQALKDDGETIDVMDAGTAMRFATAYYAAHTSKPVLITGTERMQRRPIGPLVEALRSLGAKIEYGGEEGYPPMRIFPAKLRGGEVSINPGVSSQFITALMLIAPSLPEGLCIRFDKNESVSVPYWQMTAELLRQLGATVEDVADGICIEALDKPEKTDFTVESDWSSASYFYAGTALTGKPVRLSAFQKPSLQGDSITEKHFEDFGVKTVWDGDSILLQKIRESEKDNRQIDCTAFPDLAQTLAVTCFGLQIPCKLTGLKTLRIKETDRIAALENELSKLGATVRSGADWLEIIPPSAFPVAQPVRIHTYNDHRMSMAFASLQPLFPHMEILDKENVRKSYPDFWAVWEDLLF